MPHPTSDSSLPLPGLPQKIFQSSPPSFLPTFDMDTEESYKTDPTGQEQEASKRPPMHHPDSGETERPASAQRVHTEPPIPSTEDSEELDEDSDPAEQPTDFNWNELHERYHRAITRAGQEEAALMQEWAQLMDYFKIWAEAGHAKETDRTFSRLRTRMAYVQHSETDLENRRNHYIEVVKAFESALNLLRNAGFRA